MKAFLKEHFVLIAGLALPIILSAVFFVSANFPMNPIDPPRYKAVFAFNYYYSHNPEYPYRIQISDAGVAELHFLPPKNEANIQHWNLPQLYLFDPQTKKGQQIEMPKIDDLTEPSVQPIPALEGKTLSGLATSPDGFIFREDYRGGGNLMTAIFGGGASGGYRYSFIKDRHRFPIEPDSELYRGGGKLIGWVTDEKKP